jgi:hypothetical protein
MNDDLSSARPLIAVVAEVPLLCDAVEAVLGDIADVQGFPAHRGDTIGLLEWLRPDAVVVDSKVEADAVAPFAFQSSSPLLHISLKNRSFRLLRNGGWEEADGAGAAEELRNILVGSIYGRRGTL